MCLLLQLTRRRGRLDPARETSATVCHLRHLRHCVTRIDPSRHDSVRETSSTVRHLRHRDRSPPASFAGTRPRGDRNALSMLKSEIFDARDLGLETGEFCLSGPTPVVRRRCLCNDKGSLDLRALRCSPAMRPNGTGWDSVLLHKRRVSVVRCQWSVAISWRKPSGCQLPPRTRHGDPRSKPGTSPATIRRVKLRRPSVTFVIFVVCCQVPDRPASRDPARETSLTLRHLRHCVTPLDASSYDPARETSLTLRHLRHLRHCVTPRDPASRFAETSSTVRHHRHFRCLRYCVAPIDPASRALTRETPSTLRHLRHLRHCVTRIDPGSQDRARETSSTVRHLRRFRHLGRRVTSIDPARRAPAGEGRGAVGRVGVSQRPANHGHQTHPVEPGEMSPPMPRL